MLVAPIFNLKPTPITMPENLAAESEPATDEMRTYDRVDGVNDSVFYIARPNEKSCRSVNASDFGVSTAADDNYSAFCKAIEYCKANPNITLKVDGGKYYFRTDKAIMLDGLKNVLIDADGAQFIFENPNYFHIVNCNCIEIRGLGITWNLDVSRLASLVKIRNASKESHSFELEFTELNEVSADIPIMAFTKYDPETLTPGTRKDFKENYVYQFPGSIKTVEKTGHNVLKVTHDGSLDNYTDGEVYLLRHHVYGGNAFNVYNTSNITFSGIKLYAVAGMGWLIENRSEHFQLLGCVIGLDPEPATLPFSAAKALTDSVFRQRLHPLKAKSLHSIKNCPIILSRTVSFQTAASTAEITLSAATISMKTEQEDCFFKAITDFAKATGSTKSWQIQSKSSWIFRPDFGLKARV